LTEIRINTYLAGVRRFLASAQAEAAALAELGLATKGVGYEMERTTRRSWLMNQSLFTARRLVYGTTLAMIAAGGVAIKMGFSFNSAMQSARVALAPVRNELGSVNELLMRLFNFTKYTPFQFKDVTIAFRQMYLGMRTIGISSDTVLMTLHSITDALSATGRTSPGALNRVAVALQHMAYLGHLTGQVVMQLARDGLPIYAALNKELGLTGDQIHHIGNLGISSQTALAALNRYIESTPGFMNAARRQALGTLHGLFTTFKDNVAQTMGLAERGWFHSLQRMAVGMNAWFDRLNRSLSKTHSLVRSLDATLTPQSHVILRLWGLIEGVLHDAWYIFKTLVTTVATSKSIWAALLGALIILRVTLYAIAHTTAIWVPLLKILIPLLIAYWIWTKAIATYETLYWMAVRLSILWDFRKLRVTNFLIDAQRAYTVATVGSIRAENGQFIAMSRTEKQILRLRRSYIALMAGEEGAALAMGTIVTAAILVIGVLVVLYFRWKRFHDLVNATAKFLYNHWYILALIPIVGPFVAGMVLMIHYWKTFVGWVKTAVHWLGRIHIPHFHLPHLGFHFPGAAGGGTVINQGSVLVGERGPEVLSLPRGAQIAPLSPAFSMAGGWGNRPIQIQLLVDGRVLAEVVARHQTNVNART
jgi:Tape measure protein